MWFEVIRWSSIIMCWVATGLNIYCLVILRRTTKEYGATIKKYRAAINYIGKIAEMYVLEDERRKKNEENENEL